VSRRALWPASGPPSPTPPDEDVRAHAPHVRTGSASARIPSPPPIPAHGAAGRALGAALARIADLHERLAHAHRDAAELLQNELAVHGERALMSSMGNHETPARLLTAEDLAARMQVDARTIRRWRKAGRIPAGIEVAGVLRWRVEEIERWLA